MTGVVVTGFGIVSAAGLGAPAHAAAVREGRSGLGPLTLFPSPRCGHLPVAEVARISAVPRAVHLGQPALAEALAHAQLPGSLLRHTALVVGTTVGGMPETEIAVARLTTSSPSLAAVWAGHECAALTQALSAHAGLGGLRSTVSNACASGALAIATGMDLLMANAADVVVAGGVDALCRMTLNGFASLLALDPDGCRPFDRNRKGTSLGEGAAFLVLETSAHARARGVHAKGELAGFGHSCDAHHATAPDPNGRGAELAMANALHMAGLSPSAIDYVNAHGTGTRDNDRAEGRALRRLFGQDMPPVSSTKRIFGHTLAAAGAIEAIVCLLAMAGDFVPGTAGLVDIDPECELSPHRTTTAGRIRCALSNSFGFGGHNTVLCFRRTETR